MSLGVSKQVFLSDKHEMSKMSSLLKNTFLLWLYFQ